MRPNCGPFQQFRPHADQVRNCGLLRKHCTTMSERNAHEMTKPVCDYEGRRRTCTRRPGNPRPTAKLICPENKWQETLLPGSKLRISPHFRAPQGLPRTQTAHSCCPTLPLCRQSLHWRGICHRGTRKPIVLSC